MLLRSNQRKLNNSFFFSCSCFAGITEVYLEKPSVFDDVAKGTKSVAIWYENVTHMLITDDLALHSDPYAIISYAIY